MVTEVHTYLKLQVCISIYDLLLLPGAKGLWHFLTPIKFLDNFIEIWIKFKFEEKQKGITHTHVYFKEGCINVLQIAF